MSMALNPLLPGTMPGAMPRPAAAAPQAGLAVDGRGLDALRLRAGTDPRGAVREAAKQFEALFMQELMKNMRASTMNVGQVDNEGSRLGTEMLDGQWATQLAGQPGGLAEAIARHLERQLGLPPTAAPAGGLSLPARPAASAAPGTVAPAVPGAAASSGPSSTSGTSGLSRNAALPSPAAAFVDRHSAAAQRAEQATGIPAAFMLAQAAHETGWGRKDIRNADGTPSNNLFGIKAGPGWSGAVAQITTTEYVGGVAQKVTAKFRAYASAEDSFADYARLMSTSPRYRGVLQNAGTAQGFAQGLQAAGYATDPAYADKLGRVINTTLRLQRAQA